MLRVEDLDVFHGDAQALDGVSLEVAAGRDRRHRRRQRRRQDLADPHHRGHAPAGARPHRLPRHRYRGLAEPSGLRSRHRAGGGRPADLSDAHGRRESRHGRDAAARAARRARATSSGCLRCSRCWPSGAAGGRHALGRRAADAGDRPLPDGRAGARDVRRALARPRAGGGAGVLRTIRDLNREGLTCVLVEQNVAVSLRLASRAYVLENGRVTLAGDRRGAARRRPGAAGLSRAVSGIAALRRISMLSAATRSVSGLSGKASAQLAQRLGAGFRTDVADALHHLEHRRGRRQRLEGESGAAGGAPWMGKGAPSAFWLQIPSEALSLLVPESTDWPGMSQRAVNTWAGRGFHSEPARSNRPSDEPSQDVEGIKVPAAPGYSCGGRARRLALRSCRL